MNKKEQLQFIEAEYPLYTNHISNRRIRHDFFKNIRTEIQAYLLGFYAADGSINEKRKTFRIQLQLQDKELVYLYKDFISPDARLFTIEPKEEKGRNNSIINGHGSFGVDIVSTILVNDLVSLGIGYNKTYSELHIPDIPKDLIKHFIRGYFDGDGSISGYIPNEKNKNSRVRCAFSICGKTKSLLDEIVAFFLENNIKINTYYLKRDNMYRIETGSKKEISKIFKLLYTDSNFYLTRKFKKFDYYVNTEVSQIISDHCRAQEVNVNESNNLPTSAEHPI